MRKSLNTKRCSKCTEIYWENEMHLCPNTNDQLERQHLIEWACLAEELIPAEELEAAAECQRQLAAQGNFVSQEWEV